MAIVAAVGLMSGTSRDAMDSAYIETDGENYLRCGKSLSLPYSATFRKKLAQLCANPDGEEDALAQQLTEYATQAIEQVLACSPSIVSVVGFPGHTLWHRPHEGYTRQLGEGGALARACQIEVVSDFRSADMRAGGEGAPLTPLYHRLLAHSIAPTLPKALRGKPLLFLNLGGVANATWIGEDGQSLLACDTGPGNALIDDWVQKHRAGQYDQDGRIAQQGRASSKIVAALLESPWFALSPPKSLDRDRFSATSKLLAGLSLQDGAATLCEFSAQAVQRASRFFPSPAALCLLCGGGRRNLALRSALERALSSPIELVDSFGFDGDALEAQAFAYLAVRVRAGLPTSLPETTGAKHPVCGGILHKPS